MMAQYYTIYMWELCVDYVIKPLCCADIYSIKVHNACTHASAGGRCRVKAGQNRKRKMGVESFLFQYKFHK